MPDFHPGVIVVTVGPFRRVYLSGRNSDAPHRVHCKHGFFSASSVSSAVYGKCGQRPVVAAVIGGFLGAPVIYFYSGILSISLCQQSEIIVLFYKTMYFRREKSPAGSDLLLIYPVVKNIVQVDHLRKLSDRLIFSPYLYAVFRVIKKDIK